VAKPTAAITDLEPFRVLSETSRSLLGRGLRYAQYTKTTPVLQRGQRVSGAYVVVAGQLRVFSLSPAGSEATLYLLNPGETCVLALNCIFNDLLYPAWVEAVAATRVAIIPGAEFRRLFESEPAVRNLTVQAFSTVVFRLMAELEEVHSYRLDRRLASFLVRHASSDGNVRMTQQEIASHLGTTREVVARLLGRLASDGLVRTGRSRVVLDDPVRLAELGSREGHAEMQTRPDSRQRPTHQSPAARATGDATSVATRDSRRR
jgi:CRP/FNR family transcriptional regulator